MTHSHTFRSTSLHCFTAARSCSFLSSQFITYSLALLQSPSIGIRILALAAAHIKGQWRG